MHRNSLFLAQKIKKKFCGGAQPPPHSPPPWAPTVPLAPRSYGARPRRLRHLGCPPDLLTLPPHFHTPSAAYVRSERATERKFQGAKVAGNETARERKGQGAIWPGSESARVLLADSLRGANWPGSEKARYPR